MIYQNRQLRRLYELHVFIGTNNLTTKETVIAWNSVDAIRQAPGEVACEPKELAFVTWERPPRLIFDTAGPSEIIAEPTIDPTDKS